MFEGLFQPIRGFKSAMKEEEESGGKAV